METITLLGIAAIAGFSVGIKAALRRVSKRKLKPSIKSRSFSETETQQSPSSETKVPLSEKGEDVLKPLLPKEEIQLPEKAETGSNEEPEETLVIALPEEPAIPPPYDIFINHHSLNKPEVETLARNLTKLGYRVFLDRWEISSQQAFQKERDMAWQECHHVLLVVTPETLESGWVREEYTLLSQRHQNDRNFNFIPVVLGESSINSLFLSEIEPINLSTKTYFNAFQRLIKNLGDKSYDKHDLEWPPKTLVPSMALTHSINAFIHQLLAQFEQNSPPPLIVLAQQDRSQIPLVNALLTLAKKHYQPTRCLHITLPYGSENDTPGYFANLAKQCQFSETINNGIEFEQALRLRVEHSKPLFLLISHFENGPNFFQIQLIGICRSLNETYANQVHIVLCGGAQLVSFKYQQSRHSLLNIAQEYVWPELERGDVYAIRDTYCQTLELNDEIADNLLDLSGGHPLLLQKCLQLYDGESTRLWQDYPTILSLDPFVWQQFIPFQQNPTEAQQIKEWLAQTDIAPSLSLFSYGHKRNELLRRLYWQNLLVEKQVNRNKRIQWRCEALRLAGQEVLAKKEE